MSMQRTSAYLSSATPQWKYDVFLSFRGDDTRKGFTDHLYAALELHGIITFKDDPEIKKGKTISPELFSAIEASRFAVIVLSENYAASTWCLDELLKILECMEGRATVLPIFYNVCPSDVRKQTGSFAEAFTKHEQNLKDETGRVQRWRDALRTVANFSGWDSKDWYETKLIKDIVEVVWKKLRPTLPTFLDNLVGIESRFKQINLLLDATMGDACFIGIWGMGGIGKTTISRVVFERKSHEFEFSIFLADVRLNVEKSGLPQLQQQLLSMIVMEKGDLWDVHQGAIMIRRFLSHKKVLLILDDVSDLSQLEYLAGNRDWFGFGSRVFITTRYERLLTKHGVERRFEVGGLNDDEALELLSWKAFKKDSPEPSYVCLCNRVVDYAKGLPLALKVLGSFLYGRDLGAWISALDKLSEVCNSDIIDTLKISYDGLEYDEKKIFLDIACFFNGKGKDQVREILDACGFYADIGIDVLSEKSLLTVSNGTLLMHDLLQKMGREIVRRESLDEPGNRSRLWRREDIDHVLSKNTGTDTVQGIIMDPDEPGLVHAKQEAVHVNAKSFSMMRNLRYLKLNNVELSNGLEYLPNSLRILKWPLFPLKSLPSSFNPEDLVELSMCYSHLEHLPKGTKPLNNLKIINLSHSLSLSKTPNFRTVPFLEHLILEGCIRLYEVDPSVGVLKNLTLINLRGCRNLLRLPSSVHGLKSLKVLSLSGCSKLESLPKELGYAESLEELDVSETAIREAPSSIGLLKNLKVFSLRGCKGPSSKPWNIMLSHFWSLLKISPNPIGLRIPSLSGLHSLTKLNLSDSNLLEGAIPDDLGCLSSLRYLNLSRNQFVSLPGSICQLSRLEMLDVQYCPRLQILQELPSGLRYFEAYNCTSLQTSGRDMIKLFTYHFKQPEQQGCMKSEFTIYGCQFVIPGNEIPEWFNHKSDGSSVSVELPPGWFSGKWMGFAVCAVFAVHADPNLSAPEDYFRCQLSVNGKSWTPWVAYALESRPVMVDHLWLCYLPRDKFFGNKWQNMYTELEFSFRVKGSRIEVKKCGVRLVYEEDAEALIEQAYSRQNSVSVREEDLEFPESGFKKAAAASVSSVSESGGFAKRGLQQSDDGAGPSETENGCIDGAEPHPKRLKQH